MSTPTSDVDRKGLFLPSEIIMEIASKVPLKSMLRFHCVSKEWFYNLKEEYFRNLYSDILLRSPSPSQSYPTFLFATLQWEPTGVQWDAIGDPAGQARRVITIKSPDSTSHYVIRTMAIKGNEDGALSESRRLYEIIHCNGLLCMAGKWGLLLEWRWPIIVCNPITLEYLALPLCIGARAYNSCFGLGFAPLSKQYKVVCVHPPVGAPSWSPNTRIPNLESILGVMKVYTLGVDTTWRVVDLHVDFYLGITFRPVHLYADGKIYWMTTGPARDECRLVSFDVESEQAIVIGNLPPTPFGYGHGFKLAHLRGRVSLFMTTCEGIDVWMLKEGCSSSNNYYSWDLRHRVRLPPALAIPREERYCQVKVEGIWELGDGDLIIVLQLAISNYFYYGRISSTRRDHAQFSGLNEYRDSWFPCSGYKPSLVSLKKYGCSMGAMVVDSRLSSPPKMQIIPPPTTI